MVWGRAIAFALAEEGAAVTVAGRRRGDLDAVVAEIGAHGRQAWAAVTDVTEDTAGRALVDGVIERHGRVDVLVNNAGIILRKPMLEASADEWREVLDTNLTGTYLCAVAAGRRMVAAGSGKIHQPHRDGRARPERPETAW